MKSSHLWVKILILLKPYNNALEREEPKSYFVMELNLSVSSLGVISLVQVHFSNMQLICACFNYLPWTCNTNGFLQLDFHWKCNIRASQWLHCNVTCVCRYNTCNVICVLWYSIWRSFAFVEETYCFLLLFCIRIHCWKSWYFACKDILDRTHKYPVIINELTILSMFDGIIIKFMDTVVYNISFGC